MYPQTQRLDEPKRCSNLHVFLIALFAAINITPRLTDIVPPLFNGIIILFCILLYIFYESDSRTILMYFVCLFWIFLTVILKIVGHSSAKWGNYLLQIGFYFSIMTMYFIGEQMSDKQKQSLAWIITIIVTVNLVDNIRLNITYPYASVHIIQPHWYPELVGLNIGATRFSTMLLFFFACTFFVFLSTGNKKQKLLFAFLSAATTYYLLFQGMRASVILLLIILFATMLYVSFSRKNNIGLGGLVFVVLVVIILFIFIVPILEFIRDLINVPRFSTRIDDIIDSFKNGIDGDSFSGRFGLYLVSLETFLKNIVFGAGDHRGALSQVESTGIGGHSEFIDTLARYGIMGAGFLTFILTNAFKTMKSYMQSKSYAALMVTMALCFVFCGFIKTVIYPEIALIVFVLFPNMQYIIKKPENN